MNNKINGLKDALLLAIGIAEDEDMAQGDKDSALDAVQESYENYLQDSLMIQPSKYGLHGFTQEQLNYLASIKLVLPSSEAMERCLRTFAEWGDASMLIALSHIATEMNYKVSGIDMRSNSAKLADFSAIITQLKTGETDDALALLEQVSDVTNITVTVE